MQGDYIPKSHLGSPRPIPPNVILEGLYLRIEHLAKVIKLSPCFHPAQCKRLNLDLWINLGVYPIEASTNF